MGDTHRFAAAWYAHAYLRELVPIYPSYAIMMGEHGISPLELSTLFIIWSATALAFEVPSGVLADRISRKRVLRVSGALKGCAFSVWLALSGFEGHALGFVLWGAGSSLMSGTAEAFLYDKLHAHGRPDDFARIYGRGVACNGLGVATAIVTGGYLAQNGYTVPLALSAAAPWAATLVVAVFMSEPPRAHAPVRAVGFAATLATGWREALTTPIVRHLVVALAVLPAIYGTLEEYVGPFLAEKPDVSLGAIGLIYALAFGARSIGVTFVDRLPPLSPRVAVAAYAFSAIPLVATLVEPIVAVTISLAVYFAVSAAAEILLQSHLQHAITGHARATVTSFAGMGRQLTGIALYLTIGGLAEQTTWHAAVGATALITLLIAAPLAATRYRVVGTTSA
jgi:hypothetical protein